MFTGLNIEFFLHRLQLKKEEKTMKDTALRKDTAKVPRNKMQNRNRVELGFSKIKLIKKIFKILNVIKNFNLFIVIEM